MPLSAVKTQNNAGRTPGAAVTDAHYDRVTDPSGNLKYAEVAGRIWVSTADIPTGSGGMVVHAANEDSRYAQLTFVLMVTTPPSTAMEICHIRTGTQATSAKRANLLIENNAGSPRLKLRAGGDVEVSGFTATLALNVPYLVQLKFDSGTNSSDGKVAGVITRLSDSTVMGSGEKTDADHGSGANVAFHQTGKVSASGTVGILMDDLAFWDGEYEFLDPASDPPTLTVGPGVPHVLFPVTPVAGGVFSLGHLTGPDHSAGAIEFDEGGYRYIAIPSDTTESTYELEVATAGGTKSEVLTVPAAAAGPAPGTVVEYVWDGEAWV